MLAVPRHNRIRKTALAAVWLLASVFAVETILATFSASGAFAAGNGNGGGNGGGNSGGGGGGNSGGGGGNSGGGGGNSGGGGGGNSGGGGGNSGGNSGGGNAGGNSGGNAGGANSNAGSGNSNAGGNGVGNTGGGNPASSASSGAVTGTATEIADPSTVLSLRETGVIKPLGLVYDEAEKRLGGRVIGAKLMIDDAKRLTYDIRVVTEDGRVRKARYDAGSLALLSIDDQQIQ